jgi:hypothetical protein
MCARWRFCWNFALYSECVKGIVQIAVLLDLILKNCMLDTYDFRYLSLEQAMLKMLLYWLLIPAVYNGP